MQFPGHLRDVAKSAKPLARKEFEWKRQGMRFTGGEDGEEDGEEAAGGDGYILEANRELGIGCKTYPRDDCVVRGVRDISDGHIGPESSSSCAADRQGHIHIPTGWNGWI